jgi:hypothetical protein
MGAATKNNQQGEQQHNYHINYQQPNINQNKKNSPFEFRVSPLMQSL